MYTEVRAENLKERDHREDRCRGGRFSIKIDVREIGLGMGLNSPGSLLLTW
jgi:hypothetical protein